MKKHWSSELEKRGACMEAVKWAREQPGPLEAWRACTRPDWMLWTFSTYRKSPLQLAHLAVSFARAALPIFEARYPKDLRPRRLIRLVARSDSIEKMRLMTASIVLWANGSDTDNAYASACSAIYAAYIIIYKDISYIMPTCQTAQDAGVTKRVCCSLIRKHYPKGPRVR